MHYLFRCPKCGELTRARRTIATRNDAPDCPTCVLTMQRQFSIPQLITQPFHLTDENNPYPGLSGKEVVEEMKREDREYEKVDYSQMPKKRTPQEVFKAAKPMREIFQELGN